MVLTPEDIEKQLLDLQEGQDELRRSVRSANIDNRIPLLATGFDVEDTLFPPAVQTVSGGNLSIAHNTWVSSIYSSADAFDTDSMHNTSTNNSRITINTAGIYQVSGLVTWLFNATGQRAARFFLNGTTSIRQVNVDAIAAVLGPSMTISMPYSLVVGDYVELQVWQNRGSTLSITSATKFEAVWIAPVP